MFHEEQVAIAINHIEGSIPIAFAQHTFLHMIGVPFHCSNCCLQACAGSVVFEQCVEKCARVDPQLAALRAVPFRVKRIGDTGAQHRRVIMHAHCSTSSVVPFGDSIPAARLGVVAPLGEGNVEASVGLVVRVARTRCRVILSDGFFHKLAELEHECMQFDTVHHDWRNPHHG